jgi:hypothetical protein
VELFFQPSGSQRTRVVPGDVLQIAWKGYWHEHDAHLTAIDAPPNVPPVAGGSAMNLEVDLESGRIALGKIQLLNKKRLARFLARLAASAGGGQPNISSGEMIRFIGATRLNPRPVFTRILDITDRHGFLNGVVVANHRTTGPWSLADRWVGKVSVFVNGVPLSLEEILTSYRTRDWTKAGETYAPPVPLEQLFALIEGDAYFVRGSVQSARTAYGLAMNGIGNHLTLEAIALSRILQANVRLENYRGVLSVANRLAALAGKVEDPSIAESLRLRSAIALSGYAYAKEQRYDLAESRLTKVETECRRYPEIRIDWLNLWGITQRRLALEAYKTDRASGMYAKRAWAALGALQDAVTLSVAFGTPFQMQRAFANLANVTSVFMSDEHVEPIDHRRTPEHLLALMGAAEHICQKHGIGRDDIYNPIFILSIARKFLPTAIDPALWRKVHLPQVAKGLAAYGDHEYASAPNVAPQQRAFLAFEICWAAVRENGIDLFQKYCGELASASEDVPDPNQEPLVAKVGKLVLFARTEHPRSEAWAEAMAQLSHYAEPSRSRKPRS